MARRGDEVNAKALRIINWTVQSDDLDFTAAQLGITRQTLYNKMKRKEDDQ